MLVGLKKDVVLLFAIFLAYFVLINLSKMLSKFINFKQRES